MQRMFLLNFVYFHSFTSILTSVLPLLLLYKLHSGNPKAWKMFLKDLLNSRVISEFSAYCCLCIVFSNDCFTSGSMCLLCVWLVLMINKILGDHLNVAACLITGEVRTLWSDVLCLWNFVTIKLLSLFVNGVWYGT